jgi:small subunit ribosomal protein S6
MINPMRKYELTIIVNPNLEKTDLEKMLEKVKKTIEDAGGKVGEIKEWGMKPLAYILKKQKQGIFYLLSCELEGKEAKAVRDKLKLEELLLRFLLVRKE